MRMNKCRPMPSAAVRDRTYKRCITCDGVGSIYFLEVEVGEAGDQARDISTSSLHFNRHRDRITIVLDDKNQREAGSSTRCSAPPRIHPRW